MKLLQLLPILLFTGFIPLAIGQPSLANTDDVAAAVATAAADATAKANAAQAAAVAVTNTLSGTIIREVPVMTKARWSSAGQTSTGILSMTSRRKVVANCAAKDLKFVFQNSTAETDGYSDITVKATIEDDLGNIYPATFSGSRTVTVPSTGALITSDAIPTLTTGKGRTYWLRVYSSWVSGNVYFNAITDNTSQPGEGWDNSVDEADAGSISVRGSSFCYSASMVLGTPLEYNPVETVLFIGDSNFDLVGQGGYLPWDDHWTVSALGRDNGRNFPYIRLGLGGSNVATVISGASAHRRAYFPYGSICIVLLGTNDVRGAVAPATVMANLVTLYKELYALGAKEVWACTLPPDTSVTNQNALRIALNDLIRAEPNPVRGVIDLDAAVSTAPNSNIWLPGYDSVDGYHFNNTSGAVLRTLIYNQIFSQR